MAKFSLSNKSLASVKKEKTASTQKPITDEPRVIERIILQEVIKEVRVEVPVEVIREVQVPIEVPVAVRVEVPVEVPVYVEKPVHRIEFVDRIVEKPVEVIKFDEASIKKLEKEKTILLVVSGILLFVTILLAIF
jgi:hypothetical protein